MVGAHILLPIPIVFRLAFVTADVLVLTLLFSTSNSNILIPNCKGHIQNTTGIFQKLHGQYGGGESTLGHHYGLLPPTIIPASLPIQISRGFNWPPRELVGSLSEEEDSTGGGDLPKQAMMDSNIVSERGRAKTTTTVMVFGIV
jgi:hypothetical protein